MCLVWVHRHPTHLFSATRVLGVVRGVMWWDTLEGFRIDWCFRRGLYESEGGVACQHLVLWNSRADFPCQ